MPTPYGIYGMPQPNYRTPGQKQPQASDMFTAAAPYSQTAVAQGAQPNQASPATGATPPSPFAAPAGRPQNFSPFGPASNPGGFETLLNNAQPQRAANVAGANQAISDMLMAPTGPSREAEASRSAFIKAQTEAQRQGREDSALSGRLLTGQLPGDAEAVRDKGLTQRADLENQLAVSDAQRNDARRQAGISSLLSMEGLGEQSRSTDAQNALAARGQDITLRGQDISAQQAADALAAQERMQDKSIASTEKISFAGLDLDTKKFQAADDNAKQGLSLEASAQAMQKTGMDRDEAYRYASLAQAKQLTERGLTNDEAKLELEKQGMTAEDARYYAGLASQEKEAALTRQFQSGENALDRALNSEQFVQKLGLDKQQFAEQIRQFNSREDFDTWAKNLDVSEAERNRVWQAQQADVQRKYQTGERLSGQEHEVLMEKMKEDNAAAAMERNQVLNLDTMEKQQALEAKTLTLKAGYDKDRQQDGFSHEEAMQHLQGEIQAELSKQGYSQEQALQGARLEAQRIDGENQRAMQERVSMAQLASTNSIALKELGIKQDQLDLSRDQIHQELINQAKELGLKETQVNAALQDQKLARAVDTASVLTEKWGDNPDTQAQAADILFSGLHDAGMVSDAQYRAGKLQGKASQFKDPASFTTWAKDNGYSDAEISKAASTIKTAAESGGTSNDLNNAQDSIDTLMSKWPTTASDQAENIKNYLHSASVGDPHATGDTSNDFGVNVAGKTVKTQGTPRIGSSGGSIGGDIKTEAPDIPESIANDPKKTADYEAMFMMKHYGVPEADAVNLLAKSTSLDRAKEAYKLVNGKDYSG